MANTKTIKNTDAKATTKTSPKSNPPQSKGKTTATTAVVEPAPNGEVMNPPATLFDNKEFCNDMKKSMNAIKKEMKSLESSALKIAFELYHIYDNKGFTVLGAKDIYELSKKEFGIARGTTSEYINVVDSFAKRDENGKVLPELSEQFAKFSISQLIVMQNMTTEMLLEIKPEMSVRDIKKLKKGNEPAEDSGEDADSDASDAIKVTEIPAPQRQVLITVGSIEEYNQNEDKIYGMIERALKVKKGEEPKYKVEISYIW